MSLGVLLSATLSINYIEKSDRRIMDPTNKAWAKGMKDLSSVILLGDEFCFCRQTFALPKLLFSVQLKLKKPLFV